MKLEVHSILKEEGGNGAAYRETLFETLHE